MQKPFYCRNLQILYAETTLILQKRNFFEYSTQVSEKVPFWNTTKGATHELNNWTSKVIVSRKSKSDTFYFANACRACARGFLQGFLQGFCRVSAVSAKWFSVSIAYTNFEWRKLSSPKTFPNSALTFHKIVLVNGAWCGSTIRLGGRCNREVSAGWHFWSTPFE